MEPEYGVLVAASALIGRGAMYVPLLKDTLKGNEEAEEQGTAGSTEQERPVASASDRIEGHQLELSDKLDELAAQLMKSAPGGGGQGGRETQLDERLERMEVCASCYACGPTRARSLARMPAPACACTRVLERIEVHCAIVRVRVHRDVCMSPLNMLSRMHTRLSSYICTPISSCAARRVSTNS